MFYFRKMNISVEIEGVECSFSSTFIKPVLKKADPALSPIHSPADDNNNSQLHLSCCAVPTNKAIYTCYICNYASKFKHNVLYYFTKCIRFIQTINAYELLHLTWKHKFDKIIKSASPYMIQNNGNQYIKIALTDTTDNRVITLNDTSSML